MKIVTLNLSVLPIKDPKKYWEWAVSQCSNDFATKFIIQAEKAYRKGGWPWDRAFIQATAYLVITDGLPVPAMIPNFKADFPFWVALDKHTPQGKAALRKVSEETGFPWRQLSWVSFYCESGLVDNAKPSQWWNREVEWRLGKVGLSFDAAKSMLRPVFIELLQDESARLQEIFGNGIPYNINGIPYNIDENGQLYFLF